MNEQYLNCRHAHDEQQRSTNPDGFIEFGILSPQETQWGLNPAEQQESTSKASRGYVRVAAALLNMPKSHVCLPTVTIISHYLKSSFYRHRQHARNQSKASRDIIKENRLRISTGSRGQNPHLHDQRTSKSRSTCDPWSQSRSTMPGSSAPIWDSFPSCF